MEENEWSEAVDKLREQLGGVWCDRWDDVVRWRADRVWRRSAGLPDPPEPWPWNGFRDEDMEWEY